MTSLPKADNLVLRLLLAALLLATAHRATDNLHSFEECVHNFGAKLLEKCDHQKLIEARAGRLKFQIFDLEQSVASFVEVAENRMSNHIRETFNRLQGSCSHFESLSKFGQTSVPKFTPEYVDGTLWPAVTAGLTMNYSKR